MKRLLFAAALLAATSAPSAASPSDGDPRRGASLYAVHCASCHGARLEGSANAPTLRHVGAAAVQWWVGSGRMPAAAPGNVQAERQPPQLDERAVSDLVAYVDGASPGGVAIPSYRLRDRPEDLVRGRLLYARNCQQCHGAVGAGNTVGYSYVAPNLWDVPPQQIADAIRIGPGPMPHFGPRQISPDDLDRVVSYVYSLRGSTGDPGGFALANYGPVAEGLAAWVIGLGALTAIIRAIGTAD